MRLQPRIILPTVAALVSAASAAEWGTDYEAALASARQQGKAVLADFTGSDWCHFCILLKKEVLEQPEFAAWAAENFVLLEVDMPNNPAFDARLREQNQALCARYKVDAFPTVLVLDDKGRPLAILAGFERNPDTVREILRPGMQAAALLRRAETAQGEDKLRAMVDAWKCIPRDLHDLNKPLQEEIMAIDTQDLSGIRAAAAADKALRDCIVAEALAPTDAAALEIVEAALAKAVPLNRQQLLELKYRILMRGLETPEDVYAAAEVAYASVDADLNLTADQKEKRKRMMRGAFANPQTSINRSKMRHRRRPKK